MVKTHRIDVEKGMCATARKLLKAAEAIPEDRLEGYRGDMLCLSGVVGELADMEVLGHKFVKHNPEAKRNRREQ
jgi:hypothetical protein